MARKQNEGEEAPESMLAQSLVEMLAKERVIPRFVDSYVVDNGRHALHEIVQCRHVPDRQRQCSGKRRSEQRRRELDVREQIVHQGLELRPSPKGTACDQDDPGQPGVDGLANAVLVFPFTFVGRDPWSIFSGVRSMAR